MKVMGTGLKGGNSFMEDYTYHFDPANPMVLGSHMLEICESLADGKASCEIHPLGIGGKADPVRLVFDVAPGPALNASVIDMGNRFRFLVNTVTAIKSPEPLPKLPVARVLWKVDPDMTTGCTAWILAGGAHHTCYSQNLTSEHLIDFAEIAGTECVVIDKNTRLNTFKKELQLAESIYR
jgi:L-arabinose isomerase